MPKGSDSKKAIKTTKEFIRTFDSIAEAANELGIQRSGIVMCCKGRLELSGGFSWVYTYLRQKVSNPLEESLFFTGPDLIPKILGPLSCSLS